MHIDEHLSGNYSSGLTEKGDEGKGEEEGGETEQKGRGGDKRVRVREGRRDEGKEGRDPEDVGVRLNVPKAAAAAAAHHTT